MTQNNSYCGGPLPAPYQTPPGTYPEPDAPPAKTSLPEGAAPMFAEKPKKVGSVTMAVALIAVGVLMVLRVVGVPLDYATILRLSPVILVALGVELLIALLRNRERRIRLDVVSVILSLVLIGLSMLAAVIPEVVYNDYTSDRANRRIENQLRDASYALTDGDRAPPIQRIDWYVNVGAGPVFADMNYTDLTAQHYSQASVAMANAYDSPDTFAADCYMLAAQMRQLVPQLSYISFGYADNTTHSAKTGDVRYNLWLEGPWDMDISTEEMAARVRSEIWFEPYGYYLDEAVYETEVAAYNSNLEAQEYQRLQEDAYNQLSVFNERWMQTTERIAQLEAELEFAEEESDERTAIITQLETLRLELESIETAQALLEQALMLETFETTQTQRQLER